MFSNRGGGNDVHAKLVAVLAALTVIANPVAALAARHHHELGRADHDPAVAVRETVAERDTVAGGETPCVPEAKTDRSAPPSPTIKPRSTPIANPFDRSMFGLAAGGGLQNEDEARLASDLDADRAVGVKWLRIDINWAQIQAGGPTSYDWTNIDAVVQGAERRGMHVLGVLVYTPSWDRPPGSDATYGPSPASYAVFAAAAVAHYAAMGVNAYEIWNEENQVNAWTPAPSPSAYTALLRAAYPAIKQADPGATVVTGGLAPSPTDGTNYAPTDFLADLYNDGAKGYFDAVGMHPYCWSATRGDQAAFSAWYQMYGAATSIRSIMVANGDGGKRIWGTEFGAPTNGPPGSYVNQATQAAMIGRAFALWSSYSWAGPLFIYQGRDQGTDTSTDQNFYGLISYDGTPKPAYAAYRLAVVTTDRDLN
jgi:polysaccharide biosynthesis protein PslG